MEERYVRATEVPEGTHVRVLTHPHTMTVVEAATERTNVVTLHCDVCTFTACGLMTYLRVVAGPDDVERDAEELVQELEAWLAMREWRADGGS